MSPSWATADLGVLVPGDPPTKLYYLDSHPVPPEGPYTTLVAVHGTGFNSRIWLPLLPHLPPHTRLLAFNRRGYAGSSPPHVSASPGAGNTEGFGRQVLDLAAFVRFAVEGLGVPAAAQGEGKGGIVLFGWSKGCACILGLLSLLSPSPPLPPRAPIAPYLPLLRSHLRLTIHHEPPQTIFALPGPGFPGPGPGLKDVFREEMNATFGAELFAVVPEGKRGEVLQAEDGLEALLDDAGTWNGSSPVEMIALCERAIDKGSGVKLATLYCEGTTMDVLVNGARWINERRAGTPGFVAGVVKGGDHFVMATDPEALVRALKETTGELGVEL